MLLLITEEHCRHGKVTVRGYAGAGEMIHVL